MKKLLIIIAFATCCSQCKTKKQYLTFENLSTAEFTAGKWRLPNGKSIDSVKQAHDSCMGIAFDANVFLIGKNDSIFVGSIVNRQTLKEVGSLKELGFDFMKLAAQFNIIANPCYEKREIKLPLKLAFDGKTIELLGVDPAVNKELNDIIMTSQEQEVQTGSWMYLDMNQVIINMMDTIKSEAGLQYRKKLLDSANMFLSAVESIGSISFMVHSNKVLSTALRDKLAQKPAAIVPGLQNPVKFFLIGPDQFQISIDGFFPILGKYMKAVIKTE